MSSEVNNVTGGYELPEQETPQPVEVPETYTMSHITFDDVKGILQLVEVALSRGALKGDEMEVVTNIRKDCMAELNNFAQWQQARQQVLIKEQAEEEAKRRNEILQAQIDKLQELEDRLVNERQRRKQAEIRVSELETRVSVEEPKQDVKEEVKPRKPSKAFEVARLLNPVTEPSVDPISEQMKQAHEIEEKSIADAYVPQSETTTPFTTDQELQDKVEETKEAFEEWDEPVEEIILDVPEDAKGTEEFFEEVEEVANAVVEVDEEVVEEKVEVEEVKDELDLYEEQLIAEEEAEKVKEEPKPSAPIITGGNAPSLKNVKVLDEPPVVTQEEEFEEIVIPDVKDLSRMTKAKISEAADKLNFDIDINTTKQGMIDSFIEQSEKLITELTDSEGFVSSTTTGTDDNEENADRQDGGYY